MNSLNSPPPPTQHYSSSSFRNVSVSAAAAAPPSFSSSHKNARLLEQSLEQKFALIRRLHHRREQTQGYGSMAPSSSSHSIHIKSEREDIITDDEERNLADGQVQSLLSDIEQSVNALALLNDQLYGMHRRNGGEIAGEETGVSSLASLERHQEMLNDYQVELGRVKRMLRDSKAHHDLLSGATASADPTRDTYTSSMAMNRDATRRLTQANSSLHSILSLSQNTSLSIDEQRFRYNAINARLASMRQRFPAMDAILHRISGRQRRDMIILAAVIGFFIVVGMMVVF